MPVCVLLDAWDGNSRDVRIIISPPIQNMLGAVLVEYTCLACSSSRQKICRCECSDKSEDRLQAALLGECEMAYSNYHKEWQIHYLNTIMSPMHILMST